MMIRRIANVATADHKPSTHQKTNDRNKASDVKRRTTRFACDLSAAFFGTGSTCTSIAQESYRKMNSPLDFASVGILQLCNGQLTIC